MRIIATAIWLCAMTGCAAVTPTEKYQKEIVAYSNANWNPTSTSASLAEYWAGAAKVAGQHGRNQEQEVFSMLTLEALKKDRGLSNQYDQYDSKFRAGDPNIFNDASAYFITITARDQCTSFGYAPQSGDFNKCVFGLRLRLQDRKFQGEVAALQLMNATRPAPLTLPVQTKCTTNGNQTACTTQ